MFNAQSFVMTIEIKQILFSVRKKRLTDVLFVRHKGFQPYSIQFSSLLHPGGDLLSYIHVYIRLNKSNTIYIHNFIAFALETQR